MNTVHALCFLCLIFLSFFFFLFVLLFFFFSNLSLTRSFSTLAGRMLVGTMMAFDKHMNLVLADCVEVRKVKKNSEEKEEKRALGLVLLRGENIVSISVDGPPPLSDRNTFRKPPQGVGVLGAVGLPAGRGLGAAQIVGQAQPGLTAAVRGVGPGGHNMVPQGFAPPPFGGPGGFAPPPFAMPPGGGMFNPGAPGMFPPGMPPGGFQPPPGFMPPPGG